MTINLSLRISQIAIVLSALQIGCSQSPSDHSVAQLAPKQQVQTEVESPSYSQAEQSSSSTDFQPNLKPHVVRKEIAEENSLEVPEVFLSTSHSAMCRVRVEDELPEIKLQKLSGGEASLSSLLGSQATVVLFWHPDPWMSRMALADLEREVFASAEPGKVAVVGIAVETPTEKVEQEVKAALASYPQLIDVDGKAFDKVGMVMLPRIYVLDSSGKIVWFDIEYSESTRRELKQTLEVLAGNE
ncbi:TlpA family protein disulfide reductase [Bythopirellula polymerisocia]|uniref:AhpC/TSA family protein n=1 Tax=Bythopirellula polymerisocia TaxID=2528003 RepID=A0A5C6C2U2_9BACT|nr:TlpA disulfide reductase family protein [Bythopirellula polymerisocia]TWU17816.1 AhpC/TSA family protein [Bythopirellula polymerisocia]